MTTRGYHGILFGASSGPPPAPGFVDFFTYTGDGTSNRLLPSTVDCSAGAVCFIRSTTAGQGTWVSAYNGTTTHVLQFGGTASNNNYTTFSASGVTIGAGGNGVAQQNNTGESFVCYVFKKDPSIVDVVFYTGTGANTTQAHGLGAVPGAIIFSRVSSTGARNMWHRGLAATDGIQMSTPNTPAAMTTLMNSTAPTSTVFSVGTSTNSNGTGITTCAILFAHDTSGTGRVRCDTYTGTAATPNNITVQGWQPDILMVRRNGSAPFNQIDQARTPGFTGNDTYSAMSSTTAATTGVDVLSLISGGFTLNITGTDFNAASTYLQIAFRR